MRRLVILLWRVALSVLAPGLAFAVFGYGSASFAEQERPVSQARRWADVDKLPNFWEGSWFTYEFRHDFTHPPKLTESAKKAAAAYLKLQTQDKNLDTEVANCLSPGMPQVMDDGSMPIRFFPAPDLILIYLEGYSQARFIIMDGREHSQKPNPTFLGESIGYWEGDTLVIDTTGFTASTLLPVMPGINPRAPAMLPHGSRMHIVERFRLTDSNTLEGRRTIYDDALFTEPVESIRHWHRDVSRSGELQEWVCSDNRDRFNPATGELQYGVKRPERTQNSNDRSR